MDPSPTVEDLRLVVAIGAHGSVGAAARSLRISQPSASQRLARLERRSGLVLFDRDTNGARPTNAGVAMLRQAEHILGHLDDTFAAVRTAARSPALSIGAFPSMAPAIFPLLDDLLPQHPIDPRADHGDRLLDWVGEGSMHGAFVAIAHQTAMARGIRVHPVGDDELVLVVPKGVQAPRTTGRQPLRDREVVFSTYDTGSEELRDRLARLGANARRGAVAAASLAGARRRNALAVVPRSAVTVDPRHGDRILDLPFRTRIRLTLVTPSDAHADLVDAIPRLRAELGLERHC